MTCVPAHANAQGLCRTTATHDSPSLLACFDQETTGTTGTATQVAGATANQGPPVNLGDTASQAPLPPPSKTFPTLAMGSTITTAAAAAAATRGSTVVAVGTTHSRIPCGTIADP